MFWAIAAVALSAIWIVVLLAICKAAKRGDHMHNVL
jgi:hypothetical protein